MNNNTHVIVRRRANIITGDSFRADRESDTNREGKKTKIEKRRKQRQITGAQRTS